MCFSRDELNERAHFFKEDCSGFIFCDSNLSTFLDAPLSLSLTLTHTLSLSHTHAHAHFLSFLLRHLFYCVAGYESKYVLQKPDGRNYSHFYSGNLGATTLTILTFCITTPSIIVRGTQCYNAECRNFWCYAESCSNWPNLCIFEIAHARHVCPSPTFSGEAREQPLEWSFV